MSVKSFILPVMITCVAFGALRIKSELDNFCSREVVKVFPSPSGEERITQVLVNCGATVDFYTSLSYEYTAKKSDYQNNYFFLIKGNAPIKVEWKKDAKNNQWLPTVRYFPNRIVQQSVIWGSLNITYETAE